MFSEGCLLKMRADPDAEKGGSGSHDGKLVPNQVK